MGPEKTGGISGTCAGGEGARHLVVHLIIRIYSWGMLLFLDVDWLPRCCVPLASTVQHCDMKLPGLAIDEVWLRLP